MALALTPYVVALTIVIVEDAQLRLVVIIVGVEVPIRSIRVPAVTASLHVYVTTTALAEAMIGDVADKLKLAF